MPCFKSLVAVCALLVLCGTARADILVESTFDTDADGWVIGEFFSRGPNSPPAFVPAGGNPGGFIQGTDLFTDAAFQAPTQFLGDLSAAYGGTLHVEQKVLSSDGANYPMALLSDGTLFLQFRTTPPVASVTDWTIFNIPLLASAGWEVSDLGANADPKPAATEAQLQQVLASLTLFSLRVDWQTGVDQTDLDNVRFETAAEPVPEPASLTLVSIAALGMGFGALRRRRATTSAAV